MMKHNDEIDYKGLQELMEFVLVSIVNLITLPFVVCWHIYHYITSTTKRT